MKPITRLIHPVNPPQRVIQRSTSYQTNTRVSPQSSNPDLKLITSIYMPPNRPQFDAFQLNRLTFHPARSWRASYRKLGFAYGTTSHFLSSSGDSNWRIITIMATLNLHPTRIRTFLFFAHYYYHYY